MSIRIKKYAGGGQPSGQRNYAFDLLKIICMVMIPFLHLGSHGGANELFEELSFEWILFKGLTLASNCAVNVFVMISGFLWLRKHLR